MSGSLVVEAHKAQLACNGEAWSLDLRCPPSALPIGFRTALRVGVAAHEGGEVVSKEAGLVVEPGTHTADSREFFLSGDKAAGILRFQQRESGWSASLGKSLMPLVLTRQAVESGLMPANGQSGLPASLRDVIPEELRYWEKEAALARETRDALVASGLFADNVVKVVDGKLRLCVTRLFLYESGEKVAPPSLIDSVKRAIGPDREVVTPCDAQDWRAAYAQARKSDSLIVMSPGDYAQTEEVCIEVAGDEDRTADVLVVSNDLPEVRDVLNGIGAAFKFDAHPEHLFVASFDLANDRGVEWIPREHETQPAPSRVTGETAPAVKRWIVVTKEDEPDGVAEERFVLGIVLEPEVEDAQGDIYSADEIRKACHVYMENYRGNTLMHDKHIEGKVLLLENFIAPTDYTIGAQAVKSGTWLQAYRVVDDDLWAACKSGDLSGLSIGGSAIREPDAQN